MSQVIIITGTRKGIGRMLSEYYLSKGNLVIGCSREESDLNHDSYFHYCLDVCDERAVVKMVREVMKKHNRIDILLNNAGIASMNHFTTTPYDTVKKVINTNFFGTFLFSREVSKIMMRKKFGRIVNYSTVAVPLRLEGESIYAASKAAIENMTQTMAKELSSFGITVNAIGPTPVYTDLIKTVPKEKIQQLLNTQAIKRFGEIQDIYNVIDFFIRHESNFITGQIVYLGGINN